MNILVINGHPDKESYCQAIFQTIVENIDSNRHELEMINLNAEEFDPVLRYGYRQRMEDNPVYSTLSRINSVGRSFHFCFILFGGVVCLVY